LGHDIFESFSRKRLEIPGIYHDIRRIKYKRYETDPLYRMQWHLPMIKSKESLGTSGRGINIAIVDDGVQHDHEDLKGNYIKDLSWDFNDNDADPNPSWDDGHGTSCAGVAAAVQNNVCGRGVAYHAGIVGIRLIGASVYDYQEAMALNYRNDKIHIYSNSWGPNDDGRRLSGPGPVTQEALKTGFMKGRIYMWAGGNGRQQQDNSNYDGYANSPYSIAIGAIDYHGLPSYYSEPGANLFAVAPSSGGGKGITTTDLLGDRGYSSGMCTYDFGGTSSAAPLAAGIVAHLLEINPNMGPRDVMEIIAKSANYKHTHDKGFGLLDLEQLIQTTRQHEVLPRDWTKKVIIQKTINQEIPKGVQWLDIMIVPKINEQMEFIEQILVTVNMNHGRHGQVDVQLQSPLSESILAQHRGDEHSGPSVWTFSTVHHWSEPLKQGEMWHFKIRDDTYNNYHGSLLAIQLTFLGR
jgi:kexin